MITKLMTRKKIFEQKLMNGELNIEAPKFINFLAGFTYEKYESLNNT